MFIFTPKNRELAEKRKIFGFSLQQYSMNAQRRFFFIRRSFLSFFITVDYHYQALLHLPCTFNPLKSVCECSKLPLSFLSIPFECTIRRNSNQSILFMYDDDINLKIFFIFLIKIMMKEGKYCCAIDSNDKTLCCKYR
jgi:hypothetical protein